MQQRDVTVYNRPCTPSLAARMLTPRVPAGVHEDACEVLFDAGYPEGSDLSGRCSGKCGGILAAGELLNLSKPHAVSVTGTH